MRSESERWDYKLARQQRRGVLRLKSERNLSYAPFGADCASAIATFATSPTNDSRRLTRPPEHWRAGSSRRKWLAGLVVSGARETAAAGIGLRLGSVGSVSLLELRAEAEQAQMRAELERHESPSELVVGIFSYLPKRG